MLDFQKLRVLWMNGALLLFCALVALAAWGFAAILVIGLVVELVGYSSDRVLWWVAFASPLWAPLCIGHLLQVLPSSMLKSVWSGRLA